VSRSEKFIIATSRMSETYLEAAPEEAEQSATTSARGQRRSTIQRLAREAVSGTEDGDAAAASAAPAATAAPNAGGTTAYTPTVPRGARAEADDDVNVEEEEEEIGSVIQSNDDVALLPPSTSKDEFWLARVVGVDSDSNSLRV
jgi:hypothetical protein